MSHFTGKVYDLTQENFQKVIAELEEAKALLRIAVEALEKYKDVKAWCSVETCYGEQRRYFEALVAAAALEKLSVYK